MRPAPILIIGMHRSGTSLLSRTLAEAGLFLGQSVNVHHEANLFMALNDWILLNLSGHWDQPPQPLCVETDTALQKVFTSYLQAFLMGPMGARYLGLSRTLRYQTIINQTGPWGWKDPRNTLTWPVWQHIFPDARLIHIARHGADVAASLSDRSRWEMEIVPERPDARFWVRWVIGRRRRVAESPATMDVDRSFALWDHYVSTSRRHVEAAGDKALELRYEDLLADPMPALSRILDFCGLEKSEAEVVRLAQPFKPDRAYAFLAKPEWVAHAERHKDLLSRHGYAPDGRLSD